MVPSLGDQADNEDDAYTWIGQVVVVLPGGENNGIHRTPTHKGAH